ncbi:MAG: TonB-dependent receptor [Bacteroidales bacterium]|nr:TonB-dependent receptor [Bacteroidales bacterium]
MKNFRKRKFKLLKKLLIVVKIFILLFTAGLMSATANIYGQDVKLTINKSNVELSELLELIESRTDFSFFYNDDLIDKTVKVHVNTHDKGIKEVLDQALEGTKITYSIKDKDIILKVKEESPLMSPHQQGIRITGTVSDNYGELLPGVNVLVRGTNQGTATDVNGEYTITVPSDTSVLLFHFLGYQTQQTEIGNRRVIAIIMQEEAATLDEVVVVAFGTQKKESVVGSVTTINPSELKVPNSNLTTAFAGQMAGIIAYQRSGEPGADNADFFVRGITTFGTNTNPLILIDGIELTSTDLARLQPDDIASFSVMKDATATALYGARGANGVIIVTTKQGKEGPAKISVRLENSWSMPTRNVELADPVTYMRLENEAAKTRDPSKTQIYSDEKIADTESGRDPVRFPSNDWLDMLFKKYTMNQRANMSVSGGGTVARYYVSGSFNHDNGMLKVDKRNNFNNNINNKSFTLRSNVSMNITKITELTVRLSGIFDDYSGPITGGEDMYKKIMKSNPVMFPAFYPVTPQTAHVNHIMFGNYDNLYTNPYAESVRGYKDKNRSQILAQVEVKQDLNFLTDGLSFRGMLNISRLSQFSVNRFYNPYYYQISTYNYQTGEYTLRNTNEDSATDYLGYGEPTGDKVTNSTFYFEGMVNYNRTFAEKHDVSALLVYIARQSLNANTSSLQLSLPSRNIGLSGRVTYSYDKRYSGEFNFGYNGSERFSHSHRFGFFPSMGVAWNISNEKFWEPIKSVVSNLKLRYSYGLVGNDQIGSTTDRFYYLSEMNMNDGNRWMQFGRDLNFRQNGISVIRYANEDITWETSAKQNYAIEIGLWNKLTLIAEYFKEHRYNILMTRSSIPLTMGLADRDRVRANVGEANGTGFDLSLEYQQNWTTDFWTSARGNFTYATSEFLVYEEPAYSEPWRSHEGKSLKQEWGYIAERLFVDDAEANNAPAQEISTQWYGGGDIKYTDVNGDGRITEIDRVPIGNPTVPEIVYGFGLSMGYKGFDASIFFQGAANESFWIEADNIQPFIGQNNLLKAIADDHWSEENRSLYSFWPRLGREDNSNNTPRSTWWMRDGSFLRLKQAEIGYSIPGNWKNKLKISNLRLYVSGTNLLLWSKFKLWDVEMAGNGLGYPIQRVYNLGINVSFN